MMEMCTGLARSAGFICIAAAILAFAAPACAGEAEPPIETITFKMPADGYVSLNITAEDGTVVRQLLSGEPMAKGKHTVAWDGLTTPIWQAPGIPVPPGTYRWDALWHTGIRLKLRGWAYHGSSDPWDNGPTTYWGGDHALPVACETDGERVYLGWAGSEAGKAMVACDLDYNVQWAAGQHFNGCVLIACDRSARSEQGSVYYCNYSTIRRTDIRTGKHLGWPGATRRSAPAADGRTQDGRTPSAPTELQIKDLWDDPRGMPAQLTWTWQEGLAACDGKLYLSFSSWDWQRADITDWRAFLSKVKAGDRVGKAIWDRLDKRCQDLIDRFLAGEKSEEELFKAPNYYTPDVRDVVAGVLRAMLSEKALIDGDDAMTREQLAEASRRIIEKTFPESTVKAESNFVAIVDPETCKAIRRVSVNVPGKLVPLGDGSFYMLQERSKVVLFNAETGEVQPIVTGLRNPGAIAVDQDGEIYVAVEIPREECPTEEASNLILVYSPDGKLLRTIGSPRGNPHTGPWDPAGMSRIWGLCVDPRGRLWAAEVNTIPKRFAVWDAKTGKHVRDLIGPTHYGASGGTICPADPDVLVGEGCEFRIDPQTGHAALTGVVTTEVYNNCARFCLRRDAPVGRLTDVPAARLYLAANFSGRVWGPGAPPQIRIWERIADGTYAYRAVIRAEGGDTGTVFWADENGDGIEQPEETARYPKSLQIGGYMLWSMNLNTDLTYYGVADGKGLRFNVTGFTPCGAPKYDLANAAELPRLNAPLASPDNRLVLSCDDNDSLFRCYDVATGKLRWTYPNTFHGVHGSHRAPGPAPGLIRGAFGFVGNAILPEPVGRIWAINTNVGEWHVLNEDGFYLTRLFQPDSQKWRYPEKAVPGADVTDIPPGLGGEDFGGSLTQGADGRIYLQAGKVALWSIEATGFDSVKRIKGGKIKITKDDAFRAQIIRGRLAQAVSPAKAMKIRKVTPNFTGNIDADFRGAEIQKFSRQDNAAVRVAAAWDYHAVYLGWDVRDQSPWMNAADEPEFMFTKGDTVDFQLAVDSTADPDRDEAVAGDVRISIGNFNGTPTAIAYRKVGGPKNPKTFSSGVVKKYVMDSVVPLADVKIHMKTRADGYVMEAAIPLAAFDIGELNGRTLPGDFGVTHSDPAGQDTVLRTFWSNQATGIVNDEVFELKMEPRNWGKLTFEE